MQGKRRRAKSGKAKTRAIASFAVGLVVYAIFVFGYLLLMMRLLHGHLTTLFDSQRILYAVAALALIVFQGVALDAATTAVMRLVNRWK